MRPALRLAEPISTRQRPTVLIVDDEPQILQTLEDLLEDEFEVLTATRGHEALAILGQQEVCVLLTDQRMPTMTGDEVLREARKSSQATRVLVTGYTDMSALVRAVNGGQIYAYVSKPWKPVEMKLLVRKAAEHYDLVRRYHQQSDLLDRVMDQFPDHIYFKDVDGNFLRSSRTFAESQGVADQAWLVGRSHCEICPGEDGQKCHLEDLEVITSGKAILDRVELVARPSRSSVWMSTTKLALPGLGMVATTRDITDQRRQAAERELQAQRQRCVSGLGRLALKGVDLQVLCEEAVENICEDLAVDYCALLSVSDGGGLSLVASKNPPVSGAPRQVGDSPLLGQLFRTGKLVQAGRESLANDPFFGPAMAYSAVAVPVKAGVKEVIWGILEVASNRPRTYSPQELEFLGMMANLLSLSIHKNIAEKELELSQRQLVQSQKLETIGQMAGGIAHDFNNVLTIIRGNAGLLTPCEEVDDILEAVDKAVGLIQQLLVFARHQPTYSEAVNLNQVLAQDERLLRRLLHCEVSLNVKLAPQPIWSPILAARLTQVLANLVVNARDAMESGGSITISLQLSEVDPGFAALEVSDTGSGMTPAVLSQIFDPFFTTKPVGQGTGLGLATSNTIVQQAGGRLEVVSSTGQGTTFRILLPTVPEPGDEAEPDPWPQKAALGEGTVLVVDYEEAIVRILSRTLSEAGYQVYSALRPQDTLELALRLEKLDLLVMDLAFAMAGGVELLEELRARHPQIRVIFTSGYGHDHEGLEGEHFLAKPFSTGDLLSAVCQALEQIVPEREQA